MDEYNPRDDLGQLRRIIHSLCNPKTLNRDDAAIPAAGMIGRVERYIADREDCVLVWANEGGRPMRAYGEFEYLGWLGKHSSKKGGGAMLFKDNGLAIVYINGTAFHHDGRAVK